MTPSQVLELFDIPNRWLFKSKRKSTWILVLEEFRNVSYEHAKELCQRIDEKKDASPWYYMAAVRKQLLLEKHEMYKRAPVVLKMGDIMRAMP